jgi:hypothetical protein
MIKHKGWPNWLNHQMEYWNDETIKVCLIAGSCSLYNPYDMTTCWAPTTSNPVSTVLEPKLLASNLICDAAVLRAAWSMGCWGMEAVNSTALQASSTSKAPHARACPGTKQLCRNCSAPGRLRRPWFRPALGFWSWESGPDLETGQRSTGSAA